MRCSEPRQAILYCHFATKDDLIAAFLRREDEDFWQHWDAVAAEHKVAPREELDTQLQWLGDRIARPGYRGCPQINIAAGYADDKRPARKVAVAHKREVRRRFEELARAMRLDQPEMFALRLGTTINGAFSNGRPLHAEWPARFLQELARMLIPKKGSK